MVHIKFGKPIKQSDLKKIWISLPIEVTENNQPCPRLCVLHIWPEFRGYGFNMSSAQDKPGQYIGPVAEDSPAEDGGLREGDHVIEVNGVNVEEASHTRVVTLIKSQPHMVSLLVLDPHTEQYYRTEGIKVHGDMRNIKRIDARKMIAGAVVSESVVAAAVHAEPKPTTGKTQMLHNRHKSANIQEEKSSLF